MGLTRLTPPATEPVSLAQAKLQIRQDETADDSLVTLYIGAARDLAEKYTGRSFITQTWRLQRDTFPSYGGAIRLERAPVQSVQAVRYYDEAEVEQTLSALDYDVDASTGEIALGYGLTWPTPLYRRNAVTVDFTAGYGLTAASVPEGIQAAILLTIGNLYVDREGNVEGGIPVAAQRLLDMYSLPLVA